MTLVNPQNKIISVTTTRASAIYINWEHANTWMKNCCETFRDNNGLVHDIGAQIKIRKKICFRIAVIRRLFTCSSSNEHHLVALFV